MTAPKILIADKMKRSEFSRAMAAEHLQVILAAEALREIEQLLESGHSTRALDITREALKSLTKLEPPR